MDKLLDKALAMGISFAGGLVATKVFDFAWKKATGDEAPRAANDEMTLRRALVFSISSSAISAVVQVLSQRGADSAVKKVRASYRDKSEV